MYELKKMLREPIASGVELLAPESLAMILGGKSTVEGTGGCFCGQSGSSCGCDGTARCNCNPPIKHQVTTMQGVTHNLKPVDIKTAIIRHYKSADSLKK